MRPTSPRCGVQADVHQDPGDPPIMPIDPPFAVSRRRVADRLARGAGASQAPARGFGAMLGESIQSLQATQDQAAQASTGARHRQGDRSDRGRHGRRARPARDAAREPDPHQGRRGRPGRSSTPRSDLRPCRPSSKNLLALPAKTKALLGVSAVAILAIAFIMLKLATAPSYTLISSGPRPGADRQDHRRARRAGHRLRAAQQRHRARRQRSRRCRRRGSRSPSQGVRRLGGGSQPGYELLDKTKLGASQFQQQVTYQRALEGEVANTHQRRRGRHRRRTCRSCCPQDDLFADEASPATAAVMLGNTADTLAARAPCAASRRLTASSVKGLKTEQRHDHRRLRPAAVAVGRRHGRRRRRRDQAGAEARYARQLETTINAMLASTLGPGKAQVQGQRRPQRRQDQRRRSSRTPRRARR